MVGVLVCCFVWYLFAVWKSANCETTDTTREREQLVSLFLASSLQRIWRARLRGLLFLAESGERVYMIYYFRVPKLASWEHLVLIGCACSDTCRYFCGMRTGGCAMTIKRVQRSLFHKIQKQTSDDSCYPPFSLESAKPSRSRKRPSP